MNKTKGGAGSSIRPKNATLSRNKTVYYVTPTAGIQGTQGTTNARNKPNKRSHKSKSKSKPHKKR